MGTSLVVVLGQDLSLCCSGVSRFWGSRLRVGWRQPDLGHRRCGIWCFPTLTVGTCMGSSRSHSRGWWYRCTLWAWRHGQLWRPPAVEAVSIQLIGEHIPEGCQWEGVALRPGVHLQDQVVDACLLVCLTLTVTNGSSLDDYMDDTLTSLKVST